MVGQDDELVRPGRVLGGLDQAADRRVDPVEGLERLDPLRAAVVRQLVVVGEVGIDDVRAAVHLLDDQRGVDVAEQDVAGRPHPGVLQAAMHLRGDPRSPGLARLVLLLDHLAQEQRERAEIAARAEEEPEEGLAVADALRLVLDRGGRQVRAGGIARHQVADARAVVRQESFAVRQRGGRSPGRRSGCSRPSGARGRARTSGRPGCRRSSRGGCRPGWPRSSTAGSPPSATACGSCRGSSRSSC